MTRRMPFVLRAAVVGLFGLRIGAQQQGPPPPAPVPEPVQQTEAETAATNAANAPAPIDPTRAAADLLRRRLGLKPGPVGQPPLGPPKPPPEGLEGPDAGAASTQPANAEPDQPGITPPGSQDPKPEPGPVVDPTKAAARAIEKLLPRAKPPEVAPMPNATGTPEPFAVRPTLRETASSEPPPSRVALPWRGTLSSRYRARHGDGATDQDLTASVTFDVGIVERDPFTFHLAARGFADLDGRRADDSFQGLDNSLGGTWNARLYRAHLDAHQLPGLELLRLGRQDLDETPTPVSLDGLRADSDRMGAQKVFVSAYAGVPVHHFESSSSGDSVFGAATGLQPWRGARLRFDWMSLRDDFLALDQHDELLGIRWWQSLDQVQLRGVHTWRDGKPAELQLGATGELPLPLGFAVDYRELLRTQRAQVTELDPFYAIAAEYRPYRQIDVSLDRDFGDTFTVSTGVAARRLQDRSDEGSFNREFERLYADATLRELGVSGLTLSIAGSLWNTQGEDFRTLTGELEYRPDKRLRMQLGTGYDLFRYDVFLDRERVHVRSIYLRTDYRISDGMRMNAAYEYEREDSAEYHLFRLGVTWTF